MRALVAVLFLVSAASADEVTLKSGKKFIGIAREEGDKVVLEMAIGTVGIPKDQVTNVEFGRTPLHEFYDKLAACGSVDALLALARGEKIARLANVAYAKVIERDPENAEARAKAGYEKVDGTWRSREERRQAESAAKQDDLRGKVDAMREEKRRERKAIARIEAEYRARLAELEAQSRPPVIVYEGYSFCRTRVAPFTVYRPPSWCWCGPRGYVRSPVVYQANPPYMPYGEYVPYRRWP